MRTTFPFIVIAPPQDLIVDRKVPSVCPKERKSSCNGQTLTMERSTIKRKSIQDSLLWHQMSAHPLYGSLFITGSSRANRQKRAMEAFIRKMPVMPARMSALKGFSDTSWRGYSCSDLPEHHYSSSLWSSRVNTIKAGSEEQTINRRALSSSEDDW